MGLEQRRGVVQQQAGRTELRQLPGGGDERVVLPAAVQETRLELLARVDDRARRAPEVVDVVERVVQPEDVDAALGGTRDEPPGEVVVDGAGADEKAAAQ